jgi:homoserine kinase type II
VRPVLFVYDKTASVSGARAECDLLDVLAHYDLGAFRASRPIERGYVNKLWVIQTTKGRYVLKRRHPDLRETRRILGQHALVRHLAGVGFPAPSLVATRRGTTFVELDQEVYEVQEYVAGSLRESTSPSQAAVAARTLGRYHRAVLGFDHPALYRECERYGPEALERIWGGLMEDWRGRLPPQVGHLCAALVRHVNDLRTLYRGFGDLPELVIHGDYYAENLIWRGDTVVGVVDYDQAHWCARVLELAEALIYFAREPNRRFKHIVYPGALDLGRIAGFLRAYMEIIRLSEAEVRALPHLMRTIWMCASLQPPLQPRLTLERAAQVLPEVLALADWASVHAPDIAQLGFDVRSGRMAH